MGRPRKPLAEVQRHLTKGEIAQRLAEEAPPPFALGRPRMPVGLDTYTRKLFNKICDGLEASRLLAQSDGQFVLDYIEARRAGDTDRLRAISKEWLSERQPFPVDPSETEAQQPVEPPVTVTIPDAEATARAYAGELVAGVIPSGRLAKLATKRFLDDLEHGSARGLAFDSAAAQHVVNYICRLGLVLMPWQVFLLANVFGWKRVEDGLRRFREAFVEIAKKNGKTGLMAAIALYMADTEEGDHEPTSNVYIAATTKTQAADLCFQAAKQLRSRTPSLAERCTAFKTSILFEDVFSSIEPLASNSEKLQGRNIHCGILDELGDHKDSTLYSTFDSSTVGRRQPLVFSITTAGLNRDGIAWEVRNRAIQVLEGLPGDRFFAFICEIDEGDDWQDEKHWIKANPSLGSLVPIENLRDKFNNAKTILSQKYAVLRYHLNVWPLTSSSPWVDYNDLDEKGNAYIDDGEKIMPVDHRITAALARHTSGPPRDLSRLSNAELFELARNEKTLRPYCGGDFAVTKDLSALCMLFPPAKPDGIYEAFFRIWIPEENIVRRSRDDKVPYQVWADQGFVVTTSGSTTDFEFIEYDIVELHKKFKFRELGVDKSLIPDMFQRLEKAGIKVVAVEQGMRLSPAIRRTEKLIAEHRFCSFGHPVWNWCARNVSLGIGKIKGDAQLEKEKSRERIDAAAAAVFAVRVAMAEEQPSTASPDNFKVHYLDNCANAKPERSSKPERPVDPHAVKVRIKKTGEIKMLPKVAVQFLVANGAAVRVD